MNKDELTHHEFSQFAQFLERQCGILLSQNKSYLVKSRLMPLVREGNFGTLSELIKSTISNGQAALRDRVVDAMTTNETLWFRDKYPFDILSNTLFERYAKSRKRVRIWSAACSSGQEPYSIAMLVQEYKQRNPGAFPAGVEIVATDISSDMLARAQKACYDPLSIGRGLSEERKQRFFKVAADKHMELVPNVAKMVTFKLINLLDSYTALGQFDIVFCRNVLIYFSPKNKAKILQQIAACLQKEGVLFLGASESIADLSKSFTLVRNNPGLYYQKNIS